MTQEPKSTVSPPREPGHCPFPGTYALMAQNARLVVHLSVWPAVRSWSTRVLSPPSTLVLPSTSKHSCFGVTDTACCLGAAEPVPAPQDALLVSLSQLFPCPMLDGVQVQSLQSTGLRLAFQQAHWGFTLYCSCMPFLSLLQPPGEGRGPLVPPCAAWCSSCKWEGAQHSPDPPGPGLAS